LRRLASVFDDAAPNRLAIRSQKQSGEDHAEAVHLIDEPARTAVVGKRGGNLELKLVEGVTRLGGIVVRVNALDAVREVLRRGLHEVALAQVAADGEQLLPRLGVAERRQHRHAVAEGLVKGAHFEKIDVEEVGAHGVEQAVTEFVRDHVGARAGKERLAAHCLVEKRKACTVIEGIEILAGVLAQRQLLAVALPARMRAGDAFPGFDCRQRRLAALPEQELRRVGVELALLARAGEREPGFRRRPVRPRALFPHGWRGGSGLRIVGIEVDRHGDSSS
jgi:hypothetical protein